MTYAVGSLVRARNREWVVLPDSDDDFLVLQPLGGSAEETAGVHLDVEAVEPARFPLPDPNDVGDHTSGRLLRDALRLGFRSGAGPFRSLGQVPVDPRPYQLVPLLMAMRLDPVRLLVADDVGIGKTIESLLVARELLDQGDAQRLAVLCPPHLAEQWQREMADKFHLDAELVLSSTVRRLERNLGIGESVFERYPYLVVSTDFIKSDRRRDEFLRTCPELVIVDEAHTCAWGAEARGKHQRNQLVRGVAKDPNRHLVLVTATPHSGNEAAFRSLLEMVDPDFAELPEDLSGRTNQKQRERLAHHLVQRRRADIRHYLATDTAFPERYDREIAYSLDPEYRKLFDRVLTYARETVTDPTGGGRRKRVRWWSALALLRSLGSSPAAAAATLRNRAATADTATVEEADEIGRRTVFDLVDDDAVEMADVAPGADHIEDTDTDAKAHRRRLLDMARAADKLLGKHDTKLDEATTIVRSLLDDGYNPIVFCRFIPTAEYVAAELHDRLNARRSKKQAEIAVEAVTGRYPAQERELRVMRLGDAEQHVLVATDALSEGINLQEHFDAVVHYDLSWNPTTHEQREGRADRFGQANPEVRVVTLYSTDNQIDGVVLDVLLRKHRTIRSSLGISVPVPVDTSTVMEAIGEGLLLRETAGTADQLQMFEDFIRPKRTEWHDEWESVAEREKRSRTVFAQATIDADEVAAVLNEVQSAIGSTADVERFVPSAVRAAGGHVNPGPDDTIRFDIQETPHGLRDQLALTAAGRTEILGRFEPPAPEHGRWLGRTDPFTATLASWTLETALDPVVDGPATRSGVIRTDAVDTRTTLLLVRQRFRIKVGRAERDQDLLAEDAALLAFTGDPTDPTWLAPDDTTALLDAEPTGNVPDDTRRTFIQSVVDAADTLAPHLHSDAEVRADTLEGWYRRVRKAAQAKGVKYSVSPEEPDLLGVYVYLPPVRIGAAR